MASAKQRKVQFISNKLKFLKDQGEDLIDAVGQYVDRITTAGDAWAQGRRVDDSVECQELCQMIDAAILLLCEKCEELVDLSVQSTTGAASTPAKSDRQPAAPLASTATTSNRQSTESVQPADDTKLTPVLAKIAVIEEALYSFWSRTEKVVEQQSGIDQQLKELSSRLSELDMKHSSRFKQVKQHINDISETQDEIEQEQKTGLQNLEKQLQEISTIQTRQKAEMESQTELVENIVHVPNLLESVKENVDALDARIIGIIGDCSNKHENIETVIRDLADEVMANTQSAQILSEQQVKTTILLKQLESRLQTMETDSWRNEKDDQKQVEKGESNLRILCQMFNDRLRPLEQLRTCLNERVRMRDDNVTKLSQLIQEVAVISPILQQLEVKSSRTRCGFTAFTSLTGQIAPYTVSQYETTNVNVGGNFNADSGIFTAPVDGLYVASLSFILYENEGLEVGFKNKQSLEVSVEYKQSLDQESGTHVCFSSAATKNDTTACDVGVVDMKAGEVLYLRVYEKETNDFDCDVTFSCFLLG